MILTLKLVRINEYDCVNLNLKNLVDSQNISINKLSRSAKLRYEIIKKYYNDENFWYDHEALAKFCYVLNCNINNS